MNNELQIENKRLKQRIVAGCGGLILFAMFGVLALFALSLYSDRDAARYPGAQEISRHDNYSSLPTEFRWDNTYLVSDDTFRNVFTWYSIKFDLGAESKAIERCALLEGLDGYFIINRYTSIMVCDTDEGQMVFVNRTTFIK